MRSAKNTVKFLPKFVENEGERVDANESDNEAGNNGPGDKANMNLIPAPHFFLACNKHFHSIIQSYQLLIQNLSMIF